MPEPSDELAHHAGSSVPDQETQEFMTLFYEHSLSGMEKPEAPRQAQMWNCPLRAYSR
jgi:hypothetical protein